VRREHAPVSDTKPSTETIVGFHYVDGRRIHLQRITWTGSPVLSFDLIDADTGDLLTWYESFGHYPTLDDIRHVLAHPQTGDPDDSENGKDAGDGQDVDYCRFCHQALPLSSADDQNSGGGVADSPDKTVEGRRRNER
jgi:hypothetical protein